MSIKATILKDSISATTGVRLTTYEIEFPRFFLAELNTHRMISKNGASTRAIPIAKMIENVIADTAMPVHWGSNNAGMQSKAEVDASRKEAAKGVWLAARDATISHVRVLADKDGINGHKQWVGRLLEPWVTMKMVVSATDWNNFFHLRNHEDAQPEFRELARLMYEARQQSVPSILQPGEWHVPYITFENGRYYSSEDIELTKEQAVRVSVSCCAQVSYRKLDDSLDKALDIFQRLMESEPKHMSPAEHVATPFDRGATLMSDGITHLTKGGDLYSGNFRGWIQYRHLIPQEHMPG